MTVGVSKNGREGGRYEQKCMAMEINCIYVGLICILMAYTLCK
jgi:hypothetical protein